MKKAAAIFITVLYTAFLCFAVIGAFAADGNTSRCTAAALCVKHSNDVAADNDKEDCSSKLFSAIHTYHKQTNNTAGINKYVQPDKLSVLHKSLTDFHFLNPVKLYSTADIIAASCPLFITNRTLLL